MMTSGSSGAPFTLRLVFLAAVAQLCASRREKARMPFLRSLNETAPKGGRQLTWPIDGLAYVIAFMGPLSAGPIVGVLARDWRAFAVGLLMGIGITFLNAWLSDRFLDPWVAKFQRPLQKGMPRILANIVAFAWAVALCAISMLAPIAILGSAVLTHVR
jgi:hypothetical protein